MLVLVSFGLVLLATILLVVGLLADTLTLIYLSIAASFTAAVVLYLAFRRARPKADTDLVAPTPIAPDGAEDEPSPVDATTVTPAATTPEPVVPDTVAPAAEEPELVDADDAPVLVDDPATSAAGDDWTTDADWADDGEFDVEFPIADYDDLTVAEIMPLLPQLYTDELGVVAERERTGKNRAAILDRLDELAATGTDADALEAASIDADDAFAPAAAPAVAESPRNDALSTPPAAPRPAPARPQVPSLSDDEGDDGFVFPIAGYDELGVDQIVPLLAQLEDDELEDVKAREVAGQGRRSVLAEIDRQLGLVDAVGTSADRDDTWAEPAPAPEPRPAPAPEPAGSTALAIAGYDGLTVAQIRPLLAGLSHDELQAVLDHEVARDNRRTIVADIERRLGAGGTATPAARATKAPARKATKKATAKKATTKRSTKKSARATKRAAAPKFPIADYDTLTVAQIRPKLSGLSEAQLREVQAREESGAGRKTILNEIASRLG